jgi:hypothetical protein
MSYTQRLAPMFAAVLPLRRPPDVLDLDAAGLGDWEIRLAGGTWILSSAAGGSLDIGDATGACMRVIRQGVGHFLVGANGHASLLPAIRAAEVGETLLIAPGTYQERQPLVIDKPITLQGVDADGAPILACDAADAATIMAPCMEAGAAGFAFTASGIVIHGLRFLAVPARELSAFPAVRLFDDSGAMKGMYQDVQHALDAAAEGDLIAVPAGRHVGDLHVRTGVTLAGANIGRPGGSPARDVESTVLGRVFMDATARSLVLDGLVVWGDVTMEPADEPQRRLAIRNCVIDGRDSRIAVSLLRGTGSEIINNLILGGDEAAIRISEGFAGLSVCGNRIEAAAGASGIRVNGGAGCNHMEFLGNTFVDGDYGILLHADGRLGMQGDSVLVSGNHFGEQRAGGNGSPAIAAIHADGPLPAWLELSLGLTLNLNTYHCGNDALGPDVAFTPPDRQSVVRPLTRGGR